MGWLAGKCCKLKKLNFKHKQTSQHSIETSKMQEFNNYPHKKLNNQIPQLASDSTLQIPCLNATYASVCFSGLQK